MLRTRFVIPAQAGIQFGALRHFGRAWAPAFAGATTLRRVDRPCDGAPRALSPQAGFSLLEVLVAFVILALVGTTLFRLFGASLTNAGAADEYSRVAAFAESRLTQLAEESQPLKESSDQGTSADGRYAWATKVEPYVAPGTTDDQTRLAQLLPMRLLRLSVTVSWPGEMGTQRSLTLSTVRLAMRPQP